MTAKPFCDGPFSILKGTSWIVGKDHHGEPCHVLDQRGWGYLTGKGQSALGLDNATASARQAETQQWVVDAMNAAWNRRADLAAVQPAQVHNKIEATAFSMWKAEADRAAIREAALKEAAGLIADMSRIITHTDEDLGTLTGRNLIDPRKAAATILALIGEKK